MKTVLLILLASVGASAVTISNITVQGTNHNATNVYYETDVPAKCQLLYGTSPGVYTYQGSTANTSQYPYAGAPNVCSLSLGGLAPGATFYVLPTARPNGNDSTGICNTSGCGAAEQIVPVLSQPATHPEAPQKAAVYSPNEVDITGYTVVPMGPSATDQSCVATANVSAATNWSGSVVAGDSIRTVLGKVWYKTVLRWTAGQWCWVYDNGSPRHAGVTLPQFSPDGGANDWLVLETGQASAADFPTYGARTGPQFASKLATIKAYTPAMPTDPNNIFVGGFDSEYPGQLFDCDGCGANHIWMRNLQFGHRVDSALYPTGVVDPPAFGNYLRFVPSCTWSTPHPLGCQPDQAGTPHHIVVDRIYSPAAGWPAREAGGFSLGGNYWLAIGNYLTTEVSIPALWPAIDPSVSGAVITVPFAPLQLNQFDGNLMGYRTAVGYRGTTTATMNMTGTASTMSFTTQKNLSWQAGDKIELQPTESNGAIWRRDLSFMSWGTVTSYNSSTGAMVVALTRTNGVDTSFSNWELERPATVTFSGANIGTYTGQVWAWLDSTGLVIDYQTAAGVTASCFPTTYCHVQNEASPSRQSVPYNGQYYFTGSFNGAGTFVEAWYSVPAMTHPSYIVPWRPMPIFLNPGTNGRLSNNYITGLGQTIYSDAQGDNSDITIDHNYVYFGRDHMQSHSSWDGRGYTFRNVFETKQGARWKFTGNIIDGSAAYQNPGNALYLAGSYFSEHKSYGLTDFEARNNIFKHISTGVQCNGGGTTPPDPYPSIRIAVINNMFLDLDRDHYNATNYYSAGFASGALNTTPACIDMEFSHNTIGLTHGNGPTLITVGGSNGGNFVFGDGFTFTHNLAMMSKGYAGQNMTGVQSINGGAQYSAFPPYPLALASNTGTWTQYMNGSFLQAGAGGVIPGWKADHNVLIGAQQDPGDGTWPDLTSSDMATLCGQWISSNFSCIPGNTLLARLAATGWGGIDLKSGDPKKYPAVPTAYNGGEVGANVDDITTATGTVSSIKILAGAAYLGFSYTAPDSRACTVDVSANGTTWNRFTDSGGARPRTLVATGLTASTAYQYRLLCYFDQSAAYEFTPDQVTSGTTTTLTNLTGTVSTGFVLPRGAAKVLVTLTPLSGSASSQTCIISSPCVMNNIPNGTYTRTVQPQDLSSVPIGPASVSTITVSTGGGSVAAPTGGGLWDSLVGVIDSLTGLFDDL